MEYALRSRHDVDIYTLAYLPDRTFSEFERLNVYELPIPSFLKGFAESFFIRGIAFTALSTFARVDLRGYDAVVVSVSGIGEFLSVRNKIPGRTFAYCHTPLRAAGTKEDTYWMNKYLSPLRRIIHYPARKVYRFLQGFAWPNFDHVVCNSEKSRNRTISLGLTTEEKSSVVYPGVEIPGKDHSRDDGKYVLYVSRFAEMKRQLELVKAWERLGLWRLGYSLVLAGHPSKAGYFQKVAEYAMAVPNVKLCPDVDRGRLFDLYRRATFTVFLGYHEDFGITPIEGMSFGKNLIIPDSAGVLEVLSGAPGIYRVADSVDSDVFVANLTQVLCSMVNEYMGDKDLFYSRGEGNREYVLKKVDSWDDFAKNLDLRLEGEVR